MTVLATYQKPNETVLSFASRQLRIYAAKCLFYSKTHLKNHNINKPRSGISQGGLPHADATPRFTFPLSVHPQLCSQEPLTPLHSRYKAAGHNAAQKHTGRRIDGSVSIERRRKRTLNRQHHFSSLSLIAQGARFSRYQA